MGATSEEKGAVRYIRVLVHIPGVENWPPIVVSEITLKLGTPGIGTVDCKHLGTSRVTAILFCISFSVIE